MVILPEAVVQRNPLKRTALSSRVWVRGSSGWWLVEIAQIFQAQNSSATRIKLS
jgi:hypothetical protein